MAQTINYFAWSMPYTVVHLNNGEYVNRLIPFLFTQLFCSALVSAELQEKPNVLLIIVDDLAATESAAHATLETPALDSLAARGYRFTNNFANVPVCGASRASMLSGLAPTAERFLTYNSRLDEDAPNVVSLPAFFKQHGWHTVANGKVFDVIADSAQSWSEPVWNPEPQWHSNQEVDARGEHLQKAYIEPVEGQRPPTSEKIDVEDDAYPDGQIALKAVADLERLAQINTPFFMAVGFRKPHLPFNAPAKYWLDDASELSLPPSWEMPPDTVPSQALHRSLELRMQYDALPLFGDPTLDSAKQIIAGYYAAARFADSQVGRVLDALDDNGLTNNTIVIVTGDHGFLLGDQRMWTKHSLFEPALRTPLIIAAPFFPGGAQVKAVSDLLDVFPTVAELAGLAKPGHLDGYSLVELMQNPSLAERMNKPVSMSRWMNGVSIRDESYRYTRWNNEQNDTVAEMLFDLAADPNELQNIASRPAYAKRVAELRTQLQKRGQSSQWSEDLGKSVSMLKIANGYLGGVLMFGMVYPGYAALIIVLALVLLAVLIKQLRVSRR